MKQPKETKETLKDVLSGLDSGSIEIITSGHTTNSLRDRIENDVKHIDELRKKFKNDNGMLNVLRYESRGTGRLKMEMQCFDCGETLYAFRIGNKIVYYPSGEYWDLGAREMGEEKKFDFKFEMRHVKECAASHLKKSQRLSSTIELESGAVVFCNHFGKTILDYPKGEYNSINSILGRDNVMQYLAKQNVGYGQMGNI